MVIGRRSLLLAGVAVPVASAHSQCVTDTPSVDACLGGVRITQPPGATLNLSFFGPTLDPSLTFTRGSTATYFDATGTMQTVSGNAPRFDNDPVTHAALGLLIEEQRTNSWIWSSFASVWNPVGSGAAAPTVTDNQTTSPDGTADASRVVFPAVSVASNFSCLYQGVVTTANPYTLSVFLRGNVGGERLYLYANTGATYYRTQVTLTTAWQRFVVTTPALTAATWNFAIGTDLRDASQTATSAQTIFAWGGQVEQGAFPTSYIPTTGAAVTRSQDACSISPANMVPWYASPGGSWAAEFILTGPETFGRIIGVPTGGSVSPMFVPSTTLLMRQYDLVISLPTVNTVTLGAVSKGASTYVSGTGKVCLNAGAVATGALTGGYALLASQGIVLFGTVGGTENSNGYIRRVRYWPRVLSNAELQSVTR